MIAAMPPWDNLSPPVSVPDAPAALPSAAEAGPEFASPVEPSCPGLKPVGSGKSADVVVAVILAVAYDVAPTGDFVYE